MTPLPPPHEELTPLEIVIADFALYVNEANETGEGSDFDTTIKRLNDYVAQERKAAVRAFGEQVKALPIVKNELISNKFTLNDFFGETIDRLIEEAT